MSPGKTSLHDVMIPFMDAAKDRLRTNIAKQVQEIFPAGLIISPSHEALMPDVQLVIVRALFDAVKIDFNAFYIMKGIDQHERTRNK